MREDEDEGIRTSNASLESRPNEYLAGAESLRGNPEPPGDEENSDVNNSGSQESQPAKRHHPTEHVQHCPKSMVRGDEDNNVKNSSSSLESQPDECHARAESLPVDTEPFKKDDEDVGDRSCSSKLNFQPVTRLALWLFRRIVGLFGYLFRSRPESRLSTVQFDSGVPPIRGGVGLVLFVLIALVAQQWLHAQSPYSNLLSFAVTERLDNDVASIHELRIDNLNVYAQAACLGSDSAIALRSALDSQLNRLPKEAREDLINKAVKERTSTTSSLQDTKASISKEGKAHSYMAFWSTAYNGEIAAVSAKYTTCVMLSGIELAVAEQIAGTETTKENRQIGTKPCHCGWVRCEHCPIFEEYVTKTPIFKRQTLTIKQQMQLHQWMVKQATDQALKTVGHRQSLRDRFFNPDRTNNILASLQWRKPKKHVFLGKKVISDGSDGEANSVDYGDNVLAS